MSRFSGDGTHCSSLQWLGANSLVSVGALGPIRGPLAYFSKDASPAEPAAIRLGLPVLGKPYRPVERELPYWPRFDNLTPGQRRFYLDWMIASRVDRPVEAGYAFLFFYGLARRVLVD